MALSSFFVRDLQLSTITLDEDTSKHIAGVLRMVRGDQLLLTDGQGRKATALITDDNRKRTTVQVTELQTEAVPPVHTAIGISLVKNAARFEWFLEKATEIGVREIIPLICARTEREKFRADRLHGILVSALLQSQQTWLPLLQEPRSFEQVLALPFDRRLIAHCEETERRQLSALPAIQTGRQLILIGPEGDFTPQEIEQATAQGFMPVMLGCTRLRTETAGLVAATLLVQQNI